MKMYNYKSRIWKLYNIHLKFCDDNWLKPVALSTFHNRSTRWWSEKRMVFSGNKWLWWDRVWKNSIKNKWREYVKEWNNISYQCYWKLHNKSIS